MVNGKPAGEPHLIKLDMGPTEPLGFFGKDSFAYTLLSGVNEGLYTASVDFETGKVLEPPVPLRQRYGLSEGPAEWSPDGRYLAYQQYNGLAFSPLSEPRIIIRSLETDRERILVPDLNDLRGGPRWSPDGRAFLVRGTDKKNRGGFYLIDVQTGAATPVVQHLPESSWAICAESAWATDGTSIYCVRPDPESGGVKVLRHDIETRQETELFHALAAGFSLSLRISPDGQ